MTNTATQQATKPLKLGQVNVGYTIIGAVQIPNPKGSYLYRVIGRQGNAYVVWTYNEQDGGFYHGHYFTSNNESGNRFEAYKLIEDWINDSVK